MFMVKYEEYFDMLEITEVACAIMILDASALTLGLSWQEAVPFRKCLIALSKIMHSVALGEQD